MKYSLVNIVATLSILATITWVIGLGMTINDQLFQGPTDFSSQEQTTANSEPEQTSDDVFILAFGDSLTRGTGDISGQGYVSYLMEELKNRNEQSIFISNLAVRGYTSDQLLTQLQESEIQRQISQADIMFMTIGGNDLFQGGEVIMEYSPSTIAESLQSYSKNLESIYALIESANPESIVYHIGLYDPFGELGNAAETSKTVRNWNFQSAEIAAEYPNIVYVPSYDLFEVNVNEYLFSDQFHPNNKGYQLIGQRLASLVSLSQEVNDND